MVVTLMVPTASAAAANPSEDPQDPQFAAAAQEFGVPKQLLKAISYTKTRLQASAEQSVGGGYGLMDLTAEAPVEDGQGKGRPPRMPRTERAQTLAEAARLLQTSPDVLRGDSRQNIRGGAAVLADYAKQLHDGQLPKDLGDWYDVVAKYSGETTAEGAQQAADEVYQNLEQGASSEGRNKRSRLDASPEARPRSRNVDRLKLRNRQKPPTNPTGAECPTTITCRFVPAGYAQNSADPADFGNYDHANRPQDMSVKYIVVHDTEGSYQSAINHFQDTTEYVSCNYVIRSSDGDVTQMVRNQDVSWCAGDWYVNMHAINIEHEAIASQGATWYTEEMYQASAKLVRHLAQKYNIPLDREHIIGHDDVPTLSPTRMADQHWDPGPYWDWDHYMALVRGTSDQAERDQQHTSWQGSQKTVTISPSFADNQPELTDCSSGTCVPLPAQGSSHVLLRTAPTATAPMVSDKYLHPDGAPGTNSIGDWSAKAVAGKRYAVAGKQGDWTGIWFGGVVGWFYNPASSPTARSSKSATITPRAGLASVPIWGGAYPEAAAYPAGVPVQALQPLYELPAGQSYAVLKDKLPTDYFYDATINYSLPHDHEVIKGNEKYYQINFNKRIVYVKAADVILKQ